MLSVASSLITTWQAIVLGVLQGVTELFPVSSLGHTVLVPTLFRWGNIVAWQSDPESPWLAFVVMLHVGSAVGLLIYFWREWIAIIRAFFVTPRQAADRDTYRAPGLADHLRDDPGRHPRAAAGAHHSSRASQAVGGGDLPDDQRLHPDPGPSGSASGPKFGSSRPRRGSTQPATADSARCSTARRP